MSGILQVQRVSLRLGGRRVLDDLSLDIEDGEVLGILGPSGAGKSTLLRVLLGLACPDEGRVFVRGELASEGPRVHVPPGERRLAVVFQDLALWPHLTVAGNLEFVLRMQKWQRHTRGPRIREMLEMVGLWSKAKSSPDELSGGERQRVAMARALVASPQAVLLDEPLAHLDVQLKSELLELLRIMLAQSATTALFVTHDPREAERLSTSVAVLENGRIVQRGTFRELRALSATPFCMHLARASNLRDDSGEA